ncbi:MAG TPA: AAA family ATPase, partial [Polyangiaceae bacterium]|nr:AAA family ATPase [Polyangiaceae bacterium]
YSGIGKSSLVRAFLEGEQRRLLTLTGKFDEREGGAPYRSLLEPFRQLCRWVLARPPNQLDDWKGALNDAVGGGSAFIVQVLPELSRIVDVQPSDAPLSAEQTRTLLYAGFRRLLRAFALRLCPLVLFLDDLQWIDRASLGLLEHLFVDPELRGVLLIGAYREESVASDHPFVGSLDRIEATERTVHRLPLDSLPVADVDVVVADLLQAKPESTRALAEVVVKKTGGNPFFVRQFLTSLQEENLLEFAQGSGAWTWDLPGILAKGATENLAELLLDRLARLPSSARQVLQTLACLGSRATVPLLATLVGAQPHELRESLQIALRAEVIAETAEGFAFSHDRLQAAAYASIPESERSSRHLAIGRALQARSGATNDALFDAVVHLNRAIDLMSTVSERVQLAQLNLQMAQRLRATAASANAFSHLDLAVGLLPADHWETLPELSFDLALARAEGECLSGEHERAAATLAALARRNVDGARRAAVVRLQMAVHTALNRFAELLEIGLTYLRSVGIPWQELDERELAAQYAVMRRALADRPLESLADLPSSSSPEVLAISEVCVTMLPGAFNASPQLFALVVMHLAVLSIEHGACEFSCFAYALLSFVLGPYFGEHDLGLAFGKLGMQLAERSDNRFVAGACVTGAIVVALRTQGPRAGMPWLVRGAELADRYGDLGYAVLSREYQAMSLLAGGAPLEEAARAADQALDFCRRHRVQRVVIRVHWMCGLIRGLREPEHELGSLSNGQFDDVAYDAGLAETVERYLYSLRRLQARYWAGDFAEARATARRGRPLGHTLSQGFPHETEFWFYGALAELSCADRATQEEAIERTANDARDLNAWAVRCPATFANKAALIDAERARLMGQDADAERGFELSAELARRQRLPHE